MPSQSNPRELAARMLARKGNGEPYILLLGKACERAAGATLEVLARRMLTVAGTNAAVSPTAPDIEKLLSGFRAFWGDLDQLTRETLLRMDSGVPIPVFYQDVASLIKQGYFRQILSTGVDSLVEQALQLKGWEEGIQYRVVRIGPGQTLNRDESSAVGVTIVKLHGDLTQPEIVLDPELLVHALEQNRGFIRTELVGDCVMVGYEFECDPLSHWLNRTPGNELWFAHESDPPPEKLQQFAGSREILTVNGENATPRLFFAHLFDALIERRETVAGESDGDLRHKALAGQEYRGRQVLKKLERSVSEDYGTEGLSAQIAQQLTEVGSLRDDISGTAHVAGSLPRQIVEGLRSGAISSYIVEETLAQLRPLIEQLELDLETKETLSSQVDQALKLTRSGKNPQLVQSMLTSLSLLSDSVQGLSATLRGMLKALGSVKLV